MKNRKLTSQEVIRLIKAGEHFEATVSDAGFRIKITKYVPYCCTAIHHGGQLRKEIQGKIALSEYQRWYEEDPFTGEFIKSLPVTIIGLDSRYEYDLNRPPDECIYSEAWGKQVWKRKLTSAEIVLSKRKHSIYFKVLKALIKKLEEMFDGALVFDIHSYNYQRWNREVPLFNLGTELVDKNRFGDTVKHWMNELASISLPNIKNTTHENDVFYGRGYNLAFLKQHFKKTLVLATEIKKVYVDETNGDAYPEIIRSIQQQLKEAILNSANHFSRQLKGWDYISNDKLLDKKMESVVARVDKNLNKLLRNFELLASVNPNNTQSEQRKFFRSKFTYLPQFRYNQININPYVLKKQIVSLPIDEIQDVTVRGLYEAVANSYFDKIDLMTSLGTPTFLYNSLRYFGRPSKNDLQNASFIMHLPDIPGETTKEPRLDLQEAIHHFQDGLDQYGIDAKIETSTKVIAQVMVLNSRKKILLQPSATFSRRELNSLIEHEIGVHMLTTQNSLEQPLQVFNLGLPVNTKTQEGLAVLAEYLSGNFSLHRLKKLALRVLVVDRMCSGADFIDSFNFLINEHGADPLDAFKMVARIYRGGGFTKDYLYLSGFVSIFKFWEENNDLSPLLIGKTSLDYYSAIEEMIGREMIRKPRLITNSYQHPNIEKNSTIYNYILKGLK